MSRPIGPVTKLLILGSTAGPLMWIATTLLGFAVPVRVVVSLLAMLVAGVIVSGARVIPANLLARFLAPSGASTPYAYGYSQEQALLKQGDVAGAVALLEARAAAEPKNLDVRVRLAALYARDSARHERAAGLLREVLRDPAISPDVEWRAARMYAELCAGALGDPGSAMRELARIAQRYPDADAGRHAAAWLRELKVEHVARRTGE